MDTFRRKSQRWTKTRRVRQRNKQNHCRTNQTDLQQHTRYLCSNIQIHVTVCSIAEFTCPLCPCPLHPTNKPMVFKEAQSLYFTAVNPQHVWMLTNPHERSSIHTWLEGEQSHNNCLCTRLCLTTNISSVIGWLSLLAQSSSCKTTPAANHGYISESSASLVCSTRSRHWRCHVSSQLPVTETNTRH